MPQGSEPRRAQRILGGLRLHAGLWRTAPTRFLMSCAAIAAAATVINAPANLWGLAFASSLPFVYAAVTGLWIIAGVIAMDLLRTPGASLITNALIGVLMIPFTGGPVIVVTYLMIGAAFELLFLLTLYRVWSPWLHVASSVLFSIYYALGSIPFFGIERLAFEFQLGFVLLIVASGIAAVLIALQTATALRRRGLGTAPSAKGH